MQQTTTLGAYAQVREQALQLCSEKRFSTARLFLIGSGCTALSHPCLWEYVARRSQLAGNDAVAHSMRIAVTEAHAASGDVALREADYYLERRDFESAEFMISSAFGDDPEDQHARRGLARCYFVQAESRSDGARFRSDRERALKIARNFEIKAPVDAMVVVDLLRFSGELQLALEFNGRAQEQFAGDVRFDIREARISEQSSQLSRAAEIWERVARQSERFRIEALFKLSAIYERLERLNDLARCQSLLAVAPLTLSERLRLALLTGQDEMIHALVRLAGVGGPVSGAISQKEGSAIAEMLIDGGEIGLAVWLRRRRIPIGDRVKRILDSSGYSANGRRELPDTVAEAAAIRSPDMLLPLEKTLEMPAKPRGWPGVGQLPGNVLLVNSSLGIGGAERQFVELARALLAGGLKCDQIEIAIFSLESDRGHDHFLPDLLDLGVSVHDLGRRQFANPLLPPQINRMVEALPLTHRENVRSLWHLVNELQPGAIHGWQDRSAAAAGIVGIAASVRQIVLSARNMSPATRRDRTLLANRALFGAFIGKDNIALTANSRVAALDYAGWLQCDPERISVLPNALNLNAYRDITDSRTQLDDGKRGPLRIGGVFRLAANKRPLLWLQTIAALRNEFAVDLVPVLFGSGPLAAEVEAEAARLGLADLTIRRGISDPIELYRDLDALLLMSKVEGLPNVLLEAQAMGVPVAACEVGGVREAVKPKGKGAGLLLAADIGATEAAGQIARWLPTAIGAPAYLLRRYVEKGFDPKELARRCLNLYMGLRGDAL